MVGQIQADRQFHLARIVRALVRPLHISPGCLFRCPLPPQRIDTHTLSKLFASIAHRFPHRGQSLCPRGVGAGVHLALGVQLPNQPQTHAQPPLARLAHRATPSISRYLMNASRADAGASSGRGAAASRVVLKWAFWALVLLHRSPFYASPNMNIRLATTYALTGSQRQIIPLRNTCSFRTVSLAISRRHFRHR